MRYRWLKSKELPLIQILVGHDAALSRPKRVNDIIEMALSNNKIVSPARSSINRP